MTDTVPPVRREVVVDCDPQRAFELFTGDMTSWWPAEHHIGSAPIEEIVIEPRPGGRWYTRHQDGTETSTGFVQLFDPPGRLRVTWQVGSDWKYHPDLVTTIDVRFTAEDDGRTRVVLQHGDLEGFGEDAAAMKKVFESPDAWTRTFERYATVARQPA